MAQPFFEKNKEASCDACMDKVQSTLKRNACHLIKVDQLIKIHLKVSLDLLTFDELMILGFIYIR